MNEKSLKSVDNWLNQKLVIRSGNSAIGHSKGTYKQYKSNLKRFIDFISEKYDNAYLCDEDFIENELIHSIYEYRADYLKKGVSVSTVKTNLRAINSYYVFMSESNEIKSYPFPPGFLSETEKGSLMVRAKKILSFDEVEIVEKVIEDRELVNRRDAIIWRLAFENCLRLHELKTIELQRIDFNENKIKDIVLKGGKKRTDIKISGVLMNDINLEIKGRKISTKFLIPNPTGDVLSDQSVNSIIKSIGKHAGIEGLTSTLIRRTAINHKIARNAQDVLSISEFTNHESLATTFEEYVDLEWVKKNKLY